MTTENKAGIRSDELALYLNLKTNESSVEEFMKTLKDDPFASAVLFQLETLLDGLRELTFEADCDRQRDAIVSILQTAGLALEGARILNTDHR